MNSALASLVICGLITGIHMHHENNLIKKDGQVNRVDYQNSDEDDYDEPILPNYDMDFSDEVTDEEVRQYLDILRNANTSHYEPYIMNKILPGYGKTWMFFPNSDGTPTVISLRADSITRSMFEMMDNVKFHLYTRNNKQNSQLLTPFDQDSLSRSHLDVTKEVKVITHGWQSNYKSEVCQNLKDAYLKMHDVNVICVDWSPIASTDTSYFTSSTETRNVGRFLASMLDFLIANGVDNKKIHVMGHSLGAQVSGFAGKFFTSGKIERITAFDPAKLGFDINVASDGKLDVNDAKFVDVIHTAIGILGVEQPIGHVDFYPNSGKPPQPGCVGKPNEIEGCSHSRSYEYYAEAIENPSGFLAVKCDTFKKIKSKKCSVKGNKYVYMGPNIPHSTRGIFYLTTNISPPFAQGRIDRKPMTFRGVGN